MAQDSCFVPQITLTHSAESYTRRKEEVEQHSRIDDYKRMVSSQEQGPTERPHKHYKKTKTLEASRVLFVTALIYLLPHIAYPKALEYKVLYLEESKDRERKVRIAKCFMNSAFPTFGFRFR